MTIVSSWGPRLWRSVGLLGVSLLALGLGGRPARAQFGWGSVAFQPTIGSVLDGSALGVTPVVSDDRRYVRLSLNPYFNALQGFETVLIPAAVSGGGTGNLGGLGVGPGGQGGFGSVGPGAMGGTRVFSRVGTPAQAETLPPASAALAGMPPYPGSDALASAYVQSVRPAADPNAPAPAVVPRARGRSVERAAAPPVRRRIVRQP